MHILGYIIGTIGIIGLWSWFRARREYKMSGTWHTVSGGAYIALALSIGLIIAGLALGGYFDKSDNQKEKANILEAVSKTVTEMPASTSTIIPTPTKTSTPSVTSSSQLVKTISTPTSTQTPMVTPAPTPAVQQMTIGEARSLYSFLNRKLTDFNGTLDFAINDVRTTIQLNYSKDADIPGAYNLARDFELEMNQYITKWESMKRENDTALAKLNAISDAKEYMSFAEATSNLLLTRTEQYNSDGNSIKQSLEKYVRAIKSLLQADIENQKTDAIAQLNAIYTPKLNEINQQIIAIKEQYYKDLENLKSNSNLSLALKDRRIQALTDEANLKIDKLKLEYDKIYLEYQNKLNQLKNL